MLFNELIVASEEQKLALDSGHTADIRFDRIYKRWYYDLYEGDTLLYAGVPLDVDTMPLNRIASYSLMVIDKLSNKETYEPYSELGSRLGLIEVTQ